MFGVFDMTKEDITACKEILVSVFFSEGFDPEFYAGLDRYFSRCIGEKDRFALCAKNNSNIISGFLTGWRQPSLVGEDSVYIDLLAVSVQEQGKGCGTGLMNYLFERYRDGHFIVDTEKMSRSCGFYKKLGFYDSGIVHLEKSRAIDEYEARKNEVQRLKKECADIIGKLEGENKEKALEIMDGMGITLQ